MASKLEVAKDYLLSVAERTIGVNAYQRWQKYVDQLDHDPFERIKQKRYAVPMGGLQFVFPAVMDSLYGIIGEKGERSGWITMTKYNVVQPYIDVTSWGLIAMTTDNPLEFVGAKLAINAITHVGFDLGKAAINRLRTFRPSANILAV